LCTGSVLGQKLLVHVDDTSNADEAAANIINYYRAAPKATVAAVFNSAAPIIFAVPNNAFLQEYESIINAQPTFSVLLCNNSINAMNIPASTFPSWTKIVPAAIAAIAELQAEGYAYAKP